MQNPMLISSLAIWSEYHMAHPANLGAIEDASYPQLAEVRALDLVREIGRASCRERVWTVV